MYWSLECLLRFRIQSRPCSNCPFFLFPFVPSLDIQLLLVVPRIHVSKGGKKQTWSSTSRGMFVFNSAMLITIEWAKGVHSCYSVCAVTRTLHPYTEYMQYCNQVCESCIISLFTYTFCTYVNPATPDGWSSWRSSPWSTCTGTLYSHTRTFVLLGRRGASPSHGFFFFFSPLTLFHYCSVRSIMKCPLLMEISST